jgi:hypothetical protein
LGDYLTIPKQKKKGIKTSDIGKDIREGFMHSSSIMHGMQKEAMAGYSKNLSKKKKKRG